MELNLTLIEPDLRESAKKDWARGNILGVLSSMQNTRCLAFVFDNWRKLKERGYFEEALLYAYTGTRTNYKNWSPDAVVFLFSQADRKKLIEAGDPLPGNGPFTVYRGVAGRTAARRIRGVSWSASLERAIWFARRFQLEKPAVFETKVDKSLVLAYSADREECEFLCDIPRDLKLRKVWPTKS